MLTPPVTRLAVPTMTDLASPASPGRSLLSPGPLLLAAMIVIAALSRLLPHPPNFSPVEAIALFGGAYFAHRGWAVLVPLAAMLLSDLVLAATMGGSYLSYMTSLGFWSVYACIALTTVLGFALRGRASVGRVAGLGLVGSVLFFLVTNFFVWFGGTMYPQTAEGLVAAYVAAIPFFQYSVLGTAVYGAVLFGGFELMRRRLPVLHAQTV